LGAGDGAIVGIFTGIIAAIVETVVSIPFSAMSSEFVRSIIERVSEYADDMPADWEKWLEMGGFEASPAAFVLGFIFSVFIFSALGALGGILGISLFRKKAVPKPQGVKDVPQDPSNRQS